MRRKKTFRTRSDLAHSSSSSSGAHPCLFFDSDPRPAILCIRQSKSLLPAPTIPTPALPARKKNPSSKVTSLKLSLLTEDQIQNIQAAVSDLGCPLLNHMVSMLPRRFGIGFTCDADFIHHIRRECERAKDALCLGSRTVEAKFQRLGMEARIPIDREWLVQINLQHLRSGIMRCLREAGVRQEAVNEVVLAGTSCNIPEVRSVLLEFFGRQTFRCPIDPANLFFFSCKQYLDIVTNLMNTDVAALVGLNWGLYSL